MANLPSTTANVLGDSSLDRFDAVIIGSGAGGGTAARVLATNGLKVCILEAGTNYFLGLDDPAPGMPIPLFSNDELKLGARGLIEQQALIEPRTFRASADRGDRELIGAVNSLPKTVGGAAVHADMQCPRFNDVDFRLGTELGDVPGASFADWPLTYDELEPFYATMERLEGVQGMAGADPFASPRSGDYPLPPGPTMYVHQVLAAGAGAVGLNPFALPAARNSRPYRGRPACNDCGLCSMYGCPINAKGSVALLRDALLTGNVQLRTNSIATRLRTDASGRRVVAVEYLDPEGNRAEVSGDRYILAASAIESARLCLMSDPGGPGLGNSSGQLGRNLMFHHQTICVGIYQQDFHGERGRSVTGGFTDFRGVPNDPARPLGGIVEFGANSEKITDSLIYLLDFSFSGTQLKAFLHDSPLGSRLGALIMQGEDAPQSTNRVDLDPAVRDINGLPVPRITYQPHAFELAAREVYGPKMVELHGAAGAQFALVAPIFEGAQTPASRHILGTLRMGDDPRTSVTDRFGRFHDVENLYSADGAPMATSSGYNPTITLQALALRTAGAIVDPQRPEAVVEREV
ncbi:MAG: GMC family oxidoreductase [Deltaproteobacteria bacterium]|nr:GMC family oxidoreductase [Deltaproteobacteria bacterium]